MKKRLLAILIVLSLILSMMPMALAADEFVAADYKDKKVSVLGDSISTFGGVSNNTAYNSTIGNNAVFYAANGTTHAVSLHDTWWQQAIDALGMELCVNNSWSGSRISQDGSGPAAYKERCVQLHNAAGEDPDYIWVYLGTNDYSYHVLPWGTAEAIDKAALFVQGENGQYTYPEPATVCEAYAIMLHKSRVRYPETQIYCLGMLTRNGPDAGLTAANKELEAVATLLDITFVELESITASSADYSVSMGDALHPKGEGMDRIAQRVVNAVLGNEDQRELDVYDVTYHLTDVVSSVDAKLSVEGGEFETVLTAAEGREVEAIVIMGGEDVTATCCKDGKVFIPNVTGDITISAKATVAEIIEEEDPIDTLPELKEETQKLLNEVSYQFNTAVAGIGTLVEETMNAVADVSDIVNVAVEEVSNTTESIVKEINVWVQGITEWAAPFMSFLESIL